jgi:hypothetical protein
LQPLKKMVPDPLVPEIGGSSPKCRPAWEISIAEPNRQKPVLPSSLFTLHLRGQHSHFDSWSVKDLFIERLSLIP